MASRLYRYVPHRKVPQFLREGWVIAHPLDDCHHGQHAVLMRYEEPP
jgi:hypothetical protein